MFNFKFNLIIFVISITLSGCASSLSEIKIVADDVVLERGTNLSRAEVVNIAIEDVELPNILYTSYNSKLKGFEAVDWDTVGSYKLSYEVCVDDKTCQSEDFELNIVNNASQTSETEIQDVRKVYINATGIDVPLYHEMCERQIIDNSVVKLLDSDDGSFKQSLSIEDFAAINWNQVGDYRVSVGGCDSQLNCDETDIIIHVRDDIDQIQTHTTEE